MNGINRRLVYAFLFAVFIVIITEYKFFFGKKDTTKPTPAPGPAPETPGPAPETPEEEEEEEEPPVTQQPKGVKTTVVADIQMVDKLPAGIVKKEGYIGYSYI